MSEGEFELVEGNRNVFRDFAEPDADLKQAKAIVAARIIAVLDERPLTVRKAEEATSFAAADFSRIRNASLGWFTLDRLMKILAALDRRIRVTVHVCTAAEPGRHGRGRRSVLQRATRSAHAIADTLHVDAPDRVACVVVELPAKLLDEGVEHLPAAVATLAPDLGEQGFLGGPASAHILTRRAPKRSSHRRRANSRVSKGDNAADHFMPSGWARNRP